MHTCALCSRTTWSCVDVWVISLCMSIDSSFVLCCFARKYFFAIFFSYLFTLTSNRVIQIFCVKWTVSDVDCNNDASIVRIKRGKVFRVTTAMPGTRIDFDGRIDLSPLGSLSSQSEWVICLRNQLNSWQSSNSIALLIFGIFAMCSGQCRGHWSYTYTYCASESHWW